MMRATMPTRVSFFLDGERDLDALRGADPDRDLVLFQRGERIWVLQTYLRLARAGHPVELTGKLPEDGLVVFHVKQRRAIERQWTPASRAVLVGARADNSATAIADFEILQNRSDVAAGRKFFVPHWPQPGIVRRDPERGTAIRRVAYRGFDANLAPAFREAAFRALLERAGIDWWLDSVPFAGTATDLARVAWHDYREVDLVLAVRPPARDLHARKPATKLYNAWLGETPALLGAELAYRELRRGPLDYLEVETPEQAWSAIASLRAEPERYAAMIENGRGRVAEVGPEAALERWRELLFDTLPALAAAPRVRRWQGRPLVLKKLLKRALPRVA